MSTAISTTEKAWRSTVARLISRGGDYGISTTLLYWWGDVWFLLIIAIASTFNVGTDYVLQKYWAFTKTRRKRKKFFKEALLYLCIRAGFGLIGFLAVLFLYFYLDIPYHITGLIVAIPLWFASYPITRLLFDDSSKGLPVCIRKRWITLRKRARS